VSRGFVASFAKSSQLKTIGVVIFPSLLPVFVSLIKAAPAGNEPVVHVIAIGCVLTAQGDSSVIRFLATRATGSF